MTNVSKFNEQSKEEETVNAISHGLGAALAIAGTAVMLVFASRNSDVLGIVSASIYGFSLIFLYTMSTLYHSFRGTTVKIIFQKFDHCSIFVLIMGSYAPICLSLLGGTLGWTLFAVNAFFAIAGVIANAVNVKKWHKLSLVLYLLMGWSVILVIKPLLRVITFEEFILLLTEDYSIPLVSCFIRPRSLGLCIRSGTCLFCVEVFFIISSFFFM